VAKSGLDLDAELDHLFAAPPSEFTSARNALAKKLEAAGRKEDAARVKALKKPAPAAWAVNQLASSAPRLLQALVASGDRLRTNPTDVKSSMQERREVLNEARKAVEKALAAAGHPATADVLRRASATLEAIATYGSAAGRPVAGRLSEDVQAPGFDEVAALGILPGAAGARRPGAAPARPTEKPERRAERTKVVQRARASLRAAEKAVDAIRRKKASLEAALSEASAEEKALEAKLVEARKISEAAEAAEREARTKSS